MLRRPPFIYEGLPEPKPTVEKVAEAVKGTAHRVGVAQGPAGGALRAHRRGKRPVGPVARPVIRHSDLAGVND
jgi:hypothetical protein